MNNAISLGIGDLHSGGRKGTQFKLMVKSVEKTILISSKRPFSWCDTVH